MNETQEVRVLSKAGCSDRSEAQSVRPRGRREGSVERNRGAMDKKRIRGVEDRGERPVDRKAPATKGRRRRSDVRAAKWNVLTPGDLASRLKGRRGVAEREVSIGRSSRRGPLMAVCMSSKDRTRRRIKSPGISSTKCLRSLREQSSIDRGEVKPRVCHQRGSVGGEEGKDGAGHGLVHGARDRVSA